jgi:hypothetical protein
MIAITTSSSTRVNARGERDVFLTQQRMADRPPSDGTTSMKSSLDAASVNHFPPSAEALAVVVTASQLELRRTQRPSLGKEYLIRVGI